ncbi:MAG: hypothetical protein GY953_52695, partial [bacterium]|nr:hypothetical protein [bacterium]
MSCDAMRFNSGRLAFEVPTGELTTELPADADNPTEIQIQPADLTATATLSGKGDNRSNEGHSFFLDASFEPPELVECNPVMASDEYSPNGRASRNMSAQVNCNVTALNISPGSIVRENGVITRFTAEWITKGDVDINHGERFGEAGWRGGRFQIEVRTAYAFSLEGPVIEPFTGCRVNPRTTHLSVHKPEFYLPEIAEQVQFPERYLDVRVLNAGQPVPGNPVSMTASQKAFPIGGVLPTSTQTTVRTDEAGNARFPINPLANKSFDQTDFVATATIDSQEYTCEATVVAGFGTALEPYLSQIDEIVDTMAFSRQVLDQVLAYLPETRNEINQKQVYKELVDLLRREVLTQPDNYRRLRDWMHRNSPAVKAYLEGRELRPTPALMADFKELLRFLNASGGPEVRKATVAAAKALPALWLVAGDDGAQRRRTLPAESDQEVKATFAKLPLAFEPNVGQTKPGIDFFSRGPGYGVYLTAREALLVRAEPVSGERDVVRLALDGANARARPSAEKPLPGKSHYLLGNQPSEWHTDVPHSARVRYQEVYPGVDLVYYGNRRRLEFDFEVSPGSDPGQIRLSFPESEKIGLNADGHLQLATTAYSLTLERPVVYQEVDGERREIASEYRLASDHSVGFQLGDYDSSLPVVIDPVLQYASYLGGIGEDTPTAISLDDAGNIYVAGTSASADFPIENPLQAGLGQGGFALADAFVTKLDPTGRTLLYSTYLGGNGDDSGIGIAAFGDGSVALTGMTTS